jgi:uncharacterized alpha-E superfamily protein
MGAFATNREGRAFIMMLSRVADSFYWIGRYSERAEHACRLLQISLTARLEAGSEEADLTTDRAMRALGAAPLAARMEAMEEARILTFGREANMSSIFNAVLSARENARQVRDQITTEMWERLNRLYFRVRDSADTRNFGQTAFAFYDEAISDFHAFKGIVSGTMSHGEGFHFLSLGRSIERAQLLVRLLDLHFSQKDVTVADYGWVQLLRMCCGLEPYLRVKTADFRREPIADFLVLSNEFPRSLRFCANTIAYHIEAIGAMASATANQDCMRLAGRLAARLNYALLEDVTGRNGKAFISQVAEDCVGISEAVHAAFISYSLADRLPGVSMMGEAPMGVR